MSTILRQFLGPIEAIIVQVQEREIDLFDIDLTELAVNYQKEGSFELVEGTKFIAGLAHLMYLKALKLIPEEESAEEIAAEAATELFLEEYSSFKQVAQIFSLKEREQSFHFPRKPLFEVIEPPKRALAPAISLDEFSRLFAEMLESAQKRNVTISEDMYTLSDIIDELRERLKEQRCTFQELFNPDYGKPLLIVTFLAVLELMKNQEAWLHFENDILILERLT